jgi:3-hydroxyisobutyrate dehydrogenase-like beta-hydroxyacid dehydrogenase
MTTVAMIGLGQMGAPMAINAINAGLEVAVFDISPVAASAFSDLNARIALSPADAARGADIVCIVVFDDEQTTDVITATDGVLTSLQPGTVVAIHSTIAPETVRSLERIALNTGVQVIDAGISGGPSGATAGTLLTMVGGPADAVARAMPALESFSKEVIHAGDLGAGLALKLARNTAGYVCMAAMHEAMQIASASGVPLDVLQHTIAETGVFEQALSPFLFGGPSPLSDSDSQSLREVLMHLCALGEKDLDQALALAQALDAEVPVTETTRQTFHRVARL